MRYKLLGRSGLRVAELALGTMTFGEDWGWGASQEESRKIFDAYLEAGGNFIDTSVNYTNGTSEKFVGGFVKGQRDQYVIGTKYSLRVQNSTDPNAGGNQRKNLMRSLEQSLRNLDTDYIDLLWLHMYDEFTPIEEVMRGMDDLVRMGKVLYIGISDTPAWVISKANMLAELRGWSRFVALQLPYSIARRDPERDLLPMARAEEMAVTVWGMLGGGVLTGKYRQEGAVKRYNSASERGLEIGDEMLRLAKEWGHTPGQVAVNWVRQRPWSGAPLIPILGARSAVQAVDLLGALKFGLEAEQIQVLDALAPIEHGFPGSFIRGEEVRGLIYGETFAKTDNHRPGLYSD